MPQPARHQATPDSWQLDAELHLLAERDAAAETPLLELDLPALPGRRAIFKDESAHATGSLKHRLARALLLQGLRRGAIGEGTPLFDASSGNTAVSEAWFARSLGLPYFAVIPPTVSAGKQALIRQFGGDCIIVPAGRCCKTEASRLARERGGYFLDQFVNAAHAVDWRGHNVIAELFRQLRRDGLPEPDWFVMGAGTGGTTTCAGRYFRNTSVATKLLVVDPENSAFLHFHRCGKNPAGCLCASRVEGIGRPVAEPSFTPSLVDRMIRVPDAASYAGARWLSSRIGKPVGPSTGCNLIGAVELLSAASPGFLVTTLICDDGARYGDLLEDPARLAVQGLDVSPWEAALDDWYASGRWAPPCGNVPEAPA